MEPNNDNSAPWWHWVVGIAATVVSGVVGLALIVLVVGVWLATCTPLLD